MRGNDGIIITPPPRRAFPWDSSATDLGGGCLWKGAEEIFGFLPTSVEISGVFGERVPAEGTQPRKTQRSFYVPALEGKNHDPI